jgi:hypothetical protein
MTKAKTPKKKITPMNVQVKKQNDTSLDLKNDQNRHKNKEMPVKVKKYSKKQ